MLGQHDTPLLAAARTVGMSGARGGCRRRHADRRVQRPDTPSRLYDYFSKIFVESVEKNVYDQRQPGVTVRLNTV